MPSYAGFVLPSLRVGARKFLPASASDLCVVFIRMMDPAGAPVVNRLISFHNLYQTMRIVSSSGLAAMLGAQSQMVTNSDGYAELALVRGTELEVSIAGTGIARRITVPQKGRVNLLTLVGEASDQFDVARITPVDAPRFS